MRKFTATLIIAAALSACDKYTPQLGSGHTDGLASLEINVTMNGDKDTKAAVYDNYLPSESRIAVIHDGLTEAQTYVASGTGASQTWAAEGIGVLLDKEEKTIYAYYPGSSDISNPIAVDNQHDWMWATPAQVNEDNKNAELAMHHALSMIRVKVKLNNYTGTGDLTSISFTSPVLSNEGTMDYTNGTVTATSPGTMSLSESFEAYNLVALSGESRLHDILVVPQPETEGAVTFKVVIDDNTYTAQSEAGTIEQGTIYSYELTLGDDNTMNVASVTINPYTTNDQGVKNPWIDTAPVDEWNYITVAYNVTSNTEPTQIIGAVDMNGEPVDIPVGITSMIIEGNEIEPSQTYTFATTGEHVVTFKTDETFTSAANFFAETPITEIVATSDGFVSNITSLECMFIGCTSLTAISQLANWDTSNITNLMGTFVACEMLEDISPLTNWNTSNVDNMFGTFAMSCITDLTPLTNWDTSKVTDMTMLFAMIPATDLSPLSNWDTSSVISVNSMFMYCQYLTDASALSNWNTSKITDMGFMFSYISLTGLNIQNWDLSSLSNCNSMFINISTTGTLIYDSTKTNHDLIVSKIPSTWTAVDVSSN